MAVLIALGAARPTGAQTTAETGVTVTTQNAGSFVVEFAALDGGYAFVNSTGGTIVSVTATTGDTATATVKLAWTDTRADGNRPAYTIAVRATDLTSNVDRLDGNGTYVISAEQLSIIQVGDDALTPPMSLDTPRTIFISGPDPAAGEGSLVIVIQLNIPPSSYPTKYSTTLGVEMSPGGDGP